MDDVSTRAPARVLADRYTLLERIGSGGAGVVWRAHDRLLGRTVAVKVLHRDLANDRGTTERFRAEAAAAARLTHPNAVIVYDIGQTDDGHFLVMELVEGATLADLLQEGPLPHAVVAAIGHQVGRALGAAHARDLVHRDVKPANILLTPDGVAKVADFGIARALGEATSRLTATGHVMGTARYLAPEQLRDDPVDPRADVYALGLVLHQCLTGRPPFGEGTAIEIASRRLVGDLPAASRFRPEVPAALDEAIARATLLDPDGRFPDGAAFAAALAGLTTADAGRDLAARTQRLPRTGSTPATGTPVQHTPVDHEPSEHTPVEHTPIEHTPIEGTAVEDSEREDPAAAQSTAAIPADPRRSTRAPAQPPPTGSTTRLPPTAAPTAAPADVGRPRHAPPADEPGSSSAAGSERRRWPWVGVVVVLAAIALGSFAIFGGPDVLGLADGPQETTPVAVVSGGDHDPFGSGDEHGDRVAEAFDDDPATYWRTQRYRGNPELGGLKPGVGLWLDLGEPREVTDIVVSSITAGASFTVFVGDRAPGGDEAPEDWGSAVAEVTGADTEERIELAEATRGQVWLLWFTRLPPDGDQYRATVSDVRFEAS